MKSDRLGEELERRCDGIILLRGLGREVEMEGQTRIDAIIE